MGSGWYGWYGWYGWCSGWYGWYSGWYGWYSGWYGWYPIPYLDRVAAAPDIAPAWGKNRERERWSERYGDMGVAMEKKGGENANR